MRDAVDSDVESDRTTREIDEEIAAMEKDITELEAQIQQTTTEVKALDEQLLTTEQMIAGVGEEIRAIQLERPQINLELDNVLARLRELSRSEDYRGKEQDLKECDLRSTRLMKELDLNSQSQDHLRTKEEHLRTEKEHLRMDKRRLSEAAESLRKKKEESHERRKLLLAEKEAEIVEGLEVSLSCIVEQHDDSFSDTDMQALDIDSQSQSSSTSTSPSVQKVLLLISIATCFFVPGLIHTMIFST